MSYHQCPRRRRRRRAAREHTHTASNEPREKPLLLRRQKDDPIDKCKSSRPWPGLAYDIPRGCTPAPSHSLTLTLWPSWPSWPSCCCRRLRRSRLRLGSVQHRMAAPARLIPSEQPRDAACPHPHPGRTVSILHGVHCMMLTSSPIMSANIFRFRSADCMCSAL